jgi:integrase
MKLTATKIRSIKTPGKFYDGGGLMLQATATATKGVVTLAWLYRYQIDHSERVMGLGSARDVSLADARDLAREARRLRARGIDPIEQRKAERMAARAAELHQATFKQCLDGFLDSHGDKWRAKHLAQWRNSMAAYCKPLNAVSVADIDTAMVLRVIEPHWKRAAQTADRVRNRIGEVLGWATVRGFRPVGPLPTRWKGHLDQILPAVREIAPVVHHAALPYAEAPGLFAKLTAADAPIPELCLAFAMTTATRSVEARGARWDEIDFKTNIWTIPAERMKEGREHVVPLSTQALALIARLPRTGDCLFAINGRAKPIVAMSLRIALRRHAGEGFTVHGTCRATFRTWSDEETEGFERELKEIALSHAIGDSETERAYRHSTMVEKRRRLMQQWADYLEAPADTARVIPLRGDAAIPDKATRLRRTNHLSTGILARS